MTFEPSDLLASIEPSSIRHLSSRAAALGAINLGQGFSWDPPPPELIAAAREAADTGPHCYIHPIGLPELRAAYAREFAALGGGEYRPESEVAILSGVTAGLYIALAAVVRPGDPVVTFAPVYPFFHHHSAMVRAVLRPVRLDPENGWRFDPAELDAALRGARVLILNTPHNPTGHVFSADELETVAASVRRHEIPLVIADETYCHQVYAPNVHRSIAALPGMRERTVTFLSFGKSFNVTGWRIAAAFAPAPFLEALVTLHELISIHAPAPLQRAAVSALGLTGFTERQIRTFRERGEKLAAGLRAAGFAAELPQGTYYMTGHFRAPGADQMCEALLENVGIAAVPASAFPGSAKERWLRFCFGVSEQQIEESCRRLERLRDAVPGFVGAGSRA
jgi:N-succinyldiaminopimelate aminotransferase